MSCSLLDRSKYGESVSSDRWPIASRRAGRAVGLVAAAVLLVASLAPRSAAAEPSTKEKITGSEETPEMDDPETSDSSGSADSTDDSEGDVDTGAREPKKKDKQSSKPAADRLESFDPGTIDGTVGVGGLLYLRVTPGIDLSLIRVAEGVSIGVGGVVELGYCVFCGIFSSIDDDFSLSATNISPRGRLTVHYAPASIDFPVDFYGGFGAGPSFYTFKVEHDGSEAKASLTTVIFGVFAGLRGFFGDSGFFAYGEGQFVAEIGYSTVDVDGDGWGYEIEAKHARQGIEFAIGGGFRF
ncbi:MAG: hypothetical protein ABEL76_02115 [Bradymonadaceae bacterium]